MEYLPAGCRYRRGRFPGLVAQEILRGRLSCYLFIRGCHFLTIRRSSALSDRLSIHGPFAILNMDSLAVLRSLDLSPEVHQPSGPQNLHIPAEYIPVRTPKDILDVVLARLIFSFNEINGYEQENSTLRLLTASSSYT